MDVDFGDIECQRKLSKASTSGVHVNLVEYSESVDMDDVPELINMDDDWSEVETALNMSQRTSLKHLLVMSQTGTHTNTWFVSDLPTLESRLDRTHGFV